MAEAQEEATDGLEAEARRRAVTGTLKPIFYKGEEVAQVREYSDTLLVVLLKGNRPDKFRENASIEHSGPQGTPIPVAFEQAVRSVYGSGDSGADEGG